ncbi:MAG: endonuclease III domain-containing protein [Gammaproteobacteria bacterium]|nr:MAG: endonuclease III domain-containing protein [Gammaproteobacteria bacterium]
MAKVAVSDRLLQVFKQLSSHYGLQQWWPGETPFEVMVGAVLTQNTAWTNVERAINQLKQADALDAESIHSMPQESLAELIRPSGYFNIKAGRLRAFCEWYLEQGGFDVLKYWQTEKLRSSLLGIHGVGPETADDIMLYAFNRPVFVVDAYTRRLFHRLGLTGFNSDYETMRNFFESNLEMDTKLFNEFHALIVIHAKDVCRKKPLCDQCALHHFCQWQP